jgi:hypothetical protein
LEHDCTFYETDTSDLDGALLKQEQVSDLDEEPSDLEVDEDDVDSIVSGFSNDHNYNMSPASRISSPETCPTSDPGYESQNSPPSITFDEDVPIINLDDFDLWNQPSDPITELFPSLA